MNVSHVLEVPKGINASERCATLIGFFTRFNTQGGEGIAPREWFRDESSQGVPVDELHRRRIEGWQEKAARAVDKARHPNKYRRVTTREPSRNLERAEHGRRGPKDLHSRCLNLRSHNRE